MPLDDQCRGALRGHAFELDRTSAAAGWPADHSADGPYGLHHHSRAVTSTTVKSEYRYLLPNLDLNLAVTDSLKVRLDASRTLTRPPLNFLTPVHQCPRRPARRRTQCDRRQSEPAALPVG